MIFRNPKFILAVVAVSAMSFAISGCGEKAKASTDPAATAPPPAVVENDTDANNFKVDDPKQFPLATATEYHATDDLSATGVVSPDVSRSVPVVSLAAGRVVEINAKLGDEVKKGQILFKVRSSDIAGAFADYRKATANEQLAKTQLDRALLLYDQGAVAKSAVEVAQNAQHNAQVDVETSAEHLRLLGSDIDHPTGIVEVAAPVSGVITDQQITLASGVQALSAPNPFTISDLSHVWVICDVYENDLPQVHVGEYADLHLNAYPDRVMRARIANIAPTLDPAIRTAKVRLEVANSGLMRIGMFITATFHGKAENHASVPATAILHLHDRDWVYMPSDGSHFRRTGVTAGKMLASGMQEVASGIKPGDRVVANALVLQSTVEQ